MASDSGSEPDVDNLDNRSVTWSQQDRDIVSSCHVDLLRSEHWVLKRAARRPQEAKINAVGDRDG